MTIQKLNCNCHTCRGHKAKTSSQENDYNQMSAEELKEYLETIKGQLDYSKKGDE